MASRNHSSGVPIYNRICHHDDFDLNDIWNIAVEGILQNTDLLYTIRDYKTRKKMEQVLSEILENIPVSIDDMYKTYINFFKELGADYSLEVAKEAYEYFDVWECLDEAQERKKRVSNYFKYKKKNN